MQDIVYKLVPKLQEGECNSRISYIFNWLYTIYTICYCFAFADESRRERDFYKSRNMPCPKDITQNHEEDNEKVMEAHAESDFHRLDEQVNVCLECISNNFKNLQRRFIRCSSQATITHLKKLVAKKILNGIEKYREVSARRHYIHSVYAVYTLCTMYTMYTLCIYYI